MLFPERTPYCAPGNPFMGPLPKETEEKYKCALREVTMDLRTPFMYDSLKPLSFCGNNIGTNLSAEAFNTAVTTIMVTLESRYNPSQSTPLNTRDWARLVCVLIAATGQGFHKTGSTTPKTSLKKLRAETIDKDPIDPKYPTLFHRLAAMAEHLEHFIAPDLEDYQDWYFSLRLKTGKNMAKLATGKLEEKWQQWKADQINHCAAAYEAKIDNTVRSHTASYFTSAASSLGLNLTFEGPFNAPLPAPVTGKKHTVSGSMPAPGPSTPMPTRTNSPQVAK
jgi:hypothetical protein